ncbi:Phage late control gene D protein (GPD) [Ralstonia sp. NFACC01]|nr:Phage late control gene D protein (GPD) [Ralstonia sp. NFACC01]
MRRRTIRTRAGVRGEVVIDASNAVATKEQRTTQGTKKQETVQAAPNPDNVKVPRHTYASKSNAERAARAEWQKIQRGVATLNITLARGRAELFPSLHAKVSGWKLQIDSTGWSMERVVHNVNDSGFTTSVEFDIQPNSLEDQGSVARR